MTEAADTTDPRPREVFSAFLKLGPVLPRPEKLWLHGLMMLVLVRLVNLAQTVLGICAILQFLWMLFAKERNAGIARFGQGIAHWLAVTARSLTGESDERPFPWTSWAQSKAD